MISRQLKLPSVLDRLIKQVVLCRTACCGLLCARALTRPEPPNANRAGLLESAMKMVNDLRGTLSPLMVMRMKSKGATVVSATVVGAADAESFNSSQASGRPTSTA